MPENLFYGVKSFLEKIDSYRDKALFIFIKPYWPKKITPNHVSYVRVSIGILIFALLFFFNIETKSLILTLFIIGALTDFIDGPIARSSNQVTEFGATLDPVADRILFIPIVFYSLLRNDPLLLTWIIIAEVINMAASLYCGHKKVYIEANIFGKIKMVIMCIALVAILIVWPNQIPLSFIAILWVTVPFNVLSAIVKVIDARKIFHEK